MKPFDKGKVTYIQDCVCKYHRHFFNQREGLVLAQDDRSKQVHPDCSKWKDFIFSTTDHQSQLPDESEKISPRFSILSLGHWKLWSRCWGCCVQGMCKITKLYKKLWLNLGSKLLSKQDWF